MSRRQWFFRVALLAACAALAGPIPSLRAAPAPLTRKQKVEVVFVIDTTGSMGGWIEMCKLKFWALCSSFTNTRPAPELKVGLVDYRDKGDMWITKVYDLRDDLDAVFADLQTFRADGGGDTPEHVNQALFDAVHKVKWSTDRNTLRLIYLIGDAPAHMDYTDDVKYPVTCKEAMKRGIIINAIQCGTDNDCTKHWRDISTLAGGAFLQLPNSGAIRALTAPQDRRLQEINNELLRSIIVWGASAKRDADLSKMRSSTNLAEAAAADRVGVMIRENRVASYDLLDSMRMGRMKLESLKSDELPADMQKLNMKERREHIEKVVLRRGVLIREALDLDKKRSAHLASILSRGTDNFDGPMLDILRRQGKKFRLKY